MNCMTCGGHIPTKYLHAHMANHDAVRIGNSPEHAEATKEVVPSDDMRKISLKEEIKASAKSS